MNEVKKFWANAHKNNERGPLTGTSYNEVMGYFGLSGKINKSMNVLNIGVGLGYCTRELSKHCNAYALDICEEAINKVSDCIVKGYLHERLEELPDNHFDIVYSFLVAPHMPEKDLVKQLVNVVRSLKPNGKFYCHFGGGDDDKENNIPLRTTGGSHAPFAVQKNGRTIEYAKTLVEANGGKVIFVSGKRHFPVHRCYWYYFIIQKA